MKKIFAGILALTVIAGASQAQDVKKERKHGRKGHHKHMMAGKLNLSEEQKKKMQEINADYRKGLTELKKNDNITVKEFRERRKELSKSHKEQVQGLLTADQKAQLKKAKQERESRKVKQGEARLNKMKSNLNLSDDQVNKLKSSRQAFAEKAKQIRNDQSLSDSDKKAQMKALAGKQKEEMKSVLTKEQLEKLQQFRKDGKRKESR